MNKDPRLLCLFSEAVKLALKVLNYLMWVNFSYHFVLKIFKVVINSADVCRITRSLKNVQFFEY